MRFAPALSFASMLAALAVAQATPALAAVPTTPRGLSPSHAAHYCCYH